MLSAGAASRSKLAAVIQLQDRFQVHEASFFIVHPYAELSSGEIRDDLLDLVFRRPRQLWVGVHIAGIGDNSDEECQARPRAHVGRSTSTASLTPLALCRRAGSTRRRSTAGSPMARPPKSRTPASRAPAARMLPGCRSVWTQTGSPSPPAPWATPVGPQRTGGRFITDVGGMQCGDEVGEIHCESLPRRVARGGVLALKPAGGRPRPRVALARCGQGERESWSVVTGTCPRLSARDEDVFLELAPPGGFEVLRVETVRHQGGRRTVRP